jgi:hypothetical protein
VVVDCLARVFSRNRISVAKTIAVLAMLPLTGCANVFYAKTQTGAFSGKLTVEWIAPNQFIYRPDKDAPLVFTTPEGRRVQPQLMYTDGGSIPRLFWSAPSLGPWDFAPGYIIHDWLFQQHHCQSGDWQSYDFPKSAQILAEAIKTQMEKAGSPEPTIVFAIYEAVRSPIAEGLWNGNPCTTPVAASTPVGGAAAPVVILRIEAR